MASELDAFFQSYVEAFHEMAEYRRHGLLD
jgi:hypothetical protein